MGHSSRVMGLLDKPMWESIGRKAWALQCCGQCGTFRYPPAPVCDDCRSFEAAWKPIGGEGKILSWVRFHKTYFDDHPAPYNCVAVRLDEGPIIVSNLVGDEPAGEWIGRRVRIEYRDAKDYTLPVVRLTGKMP